MIGILRQPIVERAHLGGLEAPAFELRRPQGRPLLDRPLERFTSLIHGGSQATAGSFSAAFSCFRRGASASFSDSRRRRSARASCFSTVLREIPSLSAISSCDLCSTLRRSRTERQPAGSPL